jgi:hypothetical protein
LISGFRREVSENCAHLDYYAASSGNFYSLRNNPEEHSSRRSISILVRFAAEYPALDWPAVLPTQFLIKWVLWTIYREGGVKAEHPPDLVPRSTVSEAASPAPTRIHVLKLI